MSDNSYDAVVLITQCGGHRQSGLLTIPNGLFEPVTANSALKTWSLRTGPARKKIGRMGRL